MTRLREERKQAVIDNDEYAEVGLKAYRELGFTNKVFKDPSPLIRIEAYYTLNMMKLATVDIDRKVRESMSLFIKRGEVDIFNDFDDDRSLEGRLEFYKMFKMETPKTNLAGVRFR